MISTSPQVGSSFQLLASFEPPLPRSIVEPHWYAAYTYANHEKRVAAELAVRQVEHFLPVYGSVRRWKDRKVHLDLPLFPGYVFLRLALREKLRVLQVPSVVRLVGFDGTPAVLPDEEMEALRNALTMQLNAQPHPYLNAGRRVRIAYGPLRGLEGIVVHRKNQARLVISLDLIMRAVSVEIDEADLRPAQY
jgi:transcription antitermination factor NusG